jgi:hypothetical protein
MNRDMTRIEVFILIAVVVVILFGIMPAIDRKYKIEKEKRDAIERNIERAGEGK